MFKTGSKIDEVRVDGSLDAFLEDLIHYEKLDIRCLELPVHGLDAIKNGGLDRKRTERVKEILKDFNFEYSVHAPNPLNLMDRNNPELQLSVFRASLEFACEVESRILVYHAGRFIPEETFPINGNRRLSSDEEMRLLDIEMKALRNLSEEYPDVVICLENARPYLFHSPYCYAERINVLKKQVEGINRENIRITLDIGHLYMAAGFYDFCPVETAVKIRNLIAHTHVHDNFGKAVYHYEKMQTHQIPFGMGDSHMPVGWGEIPVAQIISTYIDSYRGMFIMELRSRYFNYVEESGANLENILAKAVELNQDVSVVRGEKS